MDFLIHWPPGPVVATVQCQGLIRIIKELELYSIIHCNKDGQDK